MTTNHTVRTHERQGARRTVTTIRSTRGRSSRRVRRLRPLFFLAPALVLLAVFRLWPIVQAAYLSFTNWDGFSQPTFTGLANYQRLLHDATFRTAILHNLLILVSLPIWVAAPLAIALILNERPVGWRVIRFALFLPSVLAPVIIGSYFELMLQFQGPLNSLLRAVGLKSLARQWLVDPNSALPVLVAIIIWAGLGVGVLIFLSSLATINPDIYDAARIDGASWPRTQWSVVLPQLRPVIAFYGVVSIIASFASLFPFVYTLTQGGPGYSTYVAEYDIYQTAFGDGHFGYGSAMGVVLFLIILVIVLIAVRFTDREETR
jgi:ABC-type sugar transport system permease subunit